MSDKSISYSFIQQRYLILDEQSCKKISYKDVIIDDKIHNYF